jgi:hypothetical protein
VLSELDRDARKRLELLQSRSASLEVARPESRGDELLQQRQAMRVRHRLGNRRELAEQALLRALA